MFEVSKNKGDVFPLHYGLGNMFNFRKMENSMFDIREVYQEFIESRR